MEELPKKHRIFIYNSLKKGFFWHNDYLGNGNSRFLGNFVSEPIYTLYIDALPFLVREDSEAGAKGEVYEIDDEVLRKIDDLEKCPVFVKREMIAVKGEDGKEIRAWTYVYPNRFKGKSWVHKEFEWI